MAMEVLRIATLQKRFDFRPLERLKGVIRWAVEFSHLYPTQVSPGFDTIVDSVLLISPRLFFITN